MKNTTDIVSTFNLRNGVSEKERESALNLFLYQAPRAVAGLIETYLVAMNQDRDGTWQRLKPQRPEIVIGRLPERADKTVELMGIGGMFAYLNVLCLAHRRRGSYCVATNPHDIFTFSGWTIHPEEDMDQRLIEMFQTRHLLRNELRRLTGLGEAPESLRFKTFKIDYGAGLRLLFERPRRRAENRQSCSALCLP